jgi:hypothetical protein
MAVASGRVDFFELEQAPVPGQAPGRVCGNCRYFHGAPVDVEAQLPGMRTLGSAYGSVRATDGICGLHDRYLTPSSSCPAHESVAVAVPNWSGDLK